MKIHAHILAWNEEKILPYTLDHYSNICEKIFIYDNMSTDGSNNIYKKYEKVKVLKWNSNNQFNDLIHIRLKNQVYKERSRNQNVDWVVVCDCDEFLYHPNLLDKLAEYKERGITVPKISGHDMVSETFPEYNGKLLTEKVKIGSERYQPMCKNIIFNPILDVNYGFGAHSFNCPGAIFSDEEELKLLHYKFLGKEYVTKLYTDRVNRLSDFNKNNKLGVHYYNIPLDYMDRMIKSNFKVI